jgi:hypothetical protein
MVTRHADAAEADDPAIVQHHRLGENAVDVQSYDSHRPASCASRFT